MSKKRIHGRIADNPSSKTISDALPLVKLAKGTIGFLRKLGVKNHKFDMIYNEADKLLQNADILTLPDRFNAAFAKEGWIVTESMNTETVKKALQFYESGKKDEAEEELLAWFREDTITQFAITRGKRFNKAQKRWDQLREALKLTLEERYWSAVPLILIACDGFASDVLGTSPFNENADLTVFDSIVGHPNSLQTLIKQITKGVRKSSDDELTLPLRHGVLHGRSLGYANRVVCMKAWLLMIALVDWAYARESEQSRIHEHESKANTSLADLAFQVRQSKRDKREMEAFEPWEKKGPFDVSLDENSPEKAIVDFLAFWKRRNYGKMAERATNFTRLPLKALAGSLRNIAESIELTDFNVLSVRQSTVARVDAVVQMNGRTLKGPVEGTFRIVGFRCKENGDIGMPTDQGNWLVQQNFMYDLLNERSIEKEQPEEQEKQSLRPSQDRGRH